MSNLLIIGAGGIGSHLIKHICECIEQEQIDAFDYNITIADSDIVELEQMRYQNFKADEMGKNKAEVLAERFKDYGVEAIKDRIRNEKQMKEFDIFVLCVDNDKTREAVIRYCFKNDKEFIDLRATGRRIFAMPKEKKLEENLKFVDSTDFNEYSCQDKDDLKKGWVQRGNRIVAEMGCQMLLNFARGHNNRIINMVV